jgi:hypothetical protein
MWHIAARHYAAELGMIIALYFSLSYRKQAVTLSFAVLFDV